MGEKEGGRIPVPFGRDAAEIMGDSGELIRNGTDGLIFVESKTEWISALRAELLERAEAHEASIYGNCPMQDGSGDWCGTVLVYDIFNKFLRAELLSRCELTDPVVEAAVKWRWQSEHDGKDTEAELFKAVCAYLEGDDAD